MTDDPTAEAAAEGEAEPAQASRPPLTRSERHRVVAGVCGGLGRHLDIDPVVFRVVIAVLCLSGGLGLFLYGLAWLIVPREPVDGRAGRTELQRVLTGRVDGQSIGAVLLTVIGTGVFFSSMGDGGQMFPLLLLGGLVFLAVRYDPERRRRARGSVRRSAPDGGPYDRLTEEGPTQQVDWVTWRQQLAQDFRAEWQERKADLHEHLRRAPVGTAQQLREQHAQARAAGTVPADTPPPGPSGYLWDPRHPERNPYGAQTPPPGAPAQPWWQRTDLPEGDPLRKPPVTAPADVPAAPVVYRHHRRRSFLGPLGLLLSAGAGTLAWWVSRAQGEEVRISTVLAAALLGLGVALLVGAKLGRARGLAVPALLLTLALAGTAGSHATVGSAFGDRFWAPTTAGDLQSEYNLGAGDARLDLSRLDPAGGTLTTSARLGAGDMRVTVPANVDVRLTVRNALGDVRLPNGEASTGSGNDRVYQLHPTSGQAAKGTLDLTLTVGIGDIQVVQA
ncbi:hypothetical protein GCM10010193_53460 [Kitasatospora atroaurantiaca]|uniref:Phage shock protein C (PspC) family protein n=1 Tax=Kitasatospora atroaurantiaca TaxID=285545 RepID=A0A561EQA2_9ACTN|nr:PspC domain-containing protein [Kitasatospora atroaurantiaca]TWE17764.1 phage shock protein C (PspC) family protein [Kitasatospora atroaurantiaca]